MSRFWPVKVDKACARVVCIPSLVRARFSANQDRQDLCCGAALIRQRGFSGREYPGTSGWAARAGCGAEEVLLQAFLSLLLRHHGYPYSFPSAPSFPRGVCGCRVRQGQSVLQSRLVCVSVMALCCGSAVGRLARNLGGMIGRSGKAAKGLAPNVLKK